MKRLSNSIGLTLVVVALLAGIAPANSKEKVLQHADVFQLEFASDPQISPDGSRVVYRRNFMDVMKDRRRSNLWIINSDGTDHRPLTTGNQSYSSPRWSPEGERLLYISSEEGSAQIYVRWMDTGQTAKLTQLTHSPGGLSWSPDGKWIAFYMFVPSSPKSFTQMPAKPEGAEWAAAPRVIDTLVFRGDGSGFFEPGYEQLFVLPAEGGTPRQLTTDPYDHGSGLSWSADGKSIIFSANRNEDRDYQPRNSEVFELTVADGSLRVLTSRYGPDIGPSVSPDGEWILYAGLDDRHQGYQPFRLYLMKRDGSQSQLISGDLDLGIEDYYWSADGKGVFIQYSENGNGKIGYLTLDGQRQEVARDLGGTSLGRPYSGGSFTVANNGRFAFTQSRPDYPADVAVGRKGEPVRRLTRLNDDLFAGKTLAPVEEIWFDSSFDGRKIQGWIAKPPDFDPSVKYPMILEIHGGPFANYGDRFSAEVQLYAAAGYVVLYTNPRGSTSYGEEFGNLIHHNYPSEDYDDLISGVDALLARGYVDPKRLYVTGGSGGGVLSSWIVGKTDRFRAAVVAKPVINWYSFVLTADGTDFFYKYWFPGFPWDNAEHYLSRSPISLVGNVTTPTMLLTGESDLRTPISESEQFYTALKLRKVDTALVRIPGASHGIANRPSQLIAKVAYILEWFKRYP